MTMGTAEASARSCESMDVHGPQWFNIINHQPFLAIASDRPPGDVTSHGKPLSRRLQLLGNVTLDPQHRHLLLIQLRRINGGHLCQGEVAWVGLIMLITF